MQTRKFEDLAREILDENQIKASRKKVKLEIETMKAISSEIKHAMIEEHIGFNELVKKLNTSPTQINKVLKGNANLTLSSLFKICSALKIKPVIKFQKARS